MLTQLVKISSNAKIGKIPATNSSRLTCPDSCPFKLNGCYADAGFHTRLNWDKVTSGARGLEWSNFLASIKATVADSRTLTICHQSTIYAQFAKRINLVSPSICPRIQSRNR